VTTLLSIPYRTKGSSPRPDDFCLEYSPHNPRTEPITPTVFNSDELLALFSKNTMSTEESFVPEKMEIRESKSKVGKLNEDTRRIVILGKGRLKYKVFKYPAQQLHKVPDEDISMS
jgi:anaphase-promoting complex subunit 4